MKNRVAIVLLFMANTISGIAQGISMLAIPWYFAAQSDMGRFGWMYALTTVCSLFWVPYSGTFVDRYNRKYVFLWITAICGTLIMGITLYGFFQGALPWYLVASVFMVTFLNYNIHYPCLYAFVQEITEAKHYQKMTSYLEVQGQLATMLAGAAGALLLEGTKNGVANVFGYPLQLGFDVEAWKIQEIFLLDASTYLVAFIIMFFIKFEPLTSRIPSKGKVWQQMQVGWDYLKGHPKMFIFGLASYGIFVTVLLEGFYLSAQYVKTHLLVDGSVYAASAMYYSVGALLAGVFVHRLFQFTTVTKAIISMTCITAALYMAMATTQSVLVFYVMIFILGLTNAGTRVMRTTFLFNHIPNKVYGRANSIFFLGNVLIRIGFIGLFALPFFQKDNHVVYAFGVLSIFLMIAALILWRFVLEANRGRNTI